MKVTPNRAREILVSVIKAKLVSFLSGSPGTGKSQIVQSIADEFKLKMIDVRLAQCDPVDLLGMPTTIGNKASYLPFDTFPVEGDSIPEGYEGFLIFFDEMNSAPNAVAAAAYKIVLDRMIGQYHLHKNVVIVCAGNLDTDGAITNPMSTAMQSRLIHIELAVDHNEWLEWATDNGIHHFITSYIRFKPGSLHNFKADHTDNTFASPRTWQFASKLLMVEKIDSKNMLPLLAGTLSEGVAREFIGFTKIYTTLPKLAAILASPDTVAVPEEPSILYALTGSIAHNATKDNLTDLMKYVVRLPVEFTVITLREIIKRNKPLMGHTAIQKWVSESAVKLF